MVNTEDLYEQGTALIEAVATQREATVKQLLEAGVNPNFCADHALVSPLHMAVQHKSLSIVFLLLAAGANPRGETSEGQTVLEVAQLHNHPRILEVLHYYLTEN